MKKYIITIIFALGIILNLSAQGDGFFTTTYSNYEDRTNDFGELPGLPNQHGLDYDVAAPLGSGILLLAGMAFAYGLKKK